MCFYILRKHRFRQFLKCFFEGVLNNLTGMSSTYVHLNPFKLIGAVL